MGIPTEPIGSIPRRVQLIEAGHDLAAGRITAADYARLAEAAVRDTIEQLEATGSPVTGCWKRPDTSDGPAGHVRRLRRRAVRR